jgi:hypothetical protein
MIEVFQRIHYKIEHDKVKYIKLKRHILIKVRLKRFVRTRFKT